MSIAPGHRRFLTVIATVAGCLILSPAHAGSCDGNQPHAAAPPAAAPNAPSPYRPNRIPARATNYYRAAWGVDDMRVQRTASGELVRFSYRVTDAERAKVLGDGDVMPHLVDPGRRLMLQVPVMENIGQLRQTGTPVAGREYWMVFSNKGDVVKTGDRVDVWIGTFHADGLVVE